MNANMCGCPSPQGVELKASGKKSTSLSNKRAGSIAKLKPCSLFISLLIMLKKASNNVKIEK